MATNMPLLCVTQVTVLGVDTLKGRGVQRQPQEKQGLEADHFIAVVPTPSAHPVSGRSPQATRHTAVPVTALCPPPPPNLPGASALSLFLSRLNWCFQPLFLVPATTPTLPSPGCPPLAGSDFPYRPRYTGFVTWTLFHVHEMGGEGAV